MSSTPGQPLGRERANETGHYALARKFAHSVGRGLGWNCFATRRNRLQSKARRDEGNGVGFCVGAK